MQLQHYTYSTFHLQYGTGTVQYSAVTVQYSAVTVQYTCSRVHTVQWRRVEYCTVSTVRGVLLGRRQCSRSSIYHDGHDFYSIFQLVLLSYESFLIICSNVNTLNILFRISSTQKVIDFLFYVNLKGLFELNSNLKFLPNREQRSYLPRLFLACAFR